ncbi:MAG: alpha/beta hydrolase family protein [Planctomycetaceae bacterium]
MNAFRFFIRVAAGLLLIQLGDVSAAEPPPGDQAIEKYLAAETKLLSLNVLAEADSREAWEAKREELKRQYWDMLGLWPVPERTPLKATVTGTVARENFTVEKVHFQSMPGLYVTGNLYLPNVAHAARVRGESENATDEKTESTHAGRVRHNKLPAVLYVCGHSGKGRDGNKTAFQQHGMWFASHGFVCLIIDTLQLGEVAGIHHGTYNQNRWWWHSAGYTSAGVECWNGVRAIDYLVSRPEVDPERIAVTGISGGGAATFWIAAADERVKVCVPVSGMSDLQSYVTDKVCNGHCDCMFLYNNYRWEWTTIGALVAPRPMLFENSGYDSIFPMPANERIRQRLATIYNWYEKKPGDLFDIGVTPGGHSDNVELRLMAYRWISKHLKADNAEVSEPPQPPFSGQELRVFPEESDLPKDSLNAKIDESFVMLAKPTTPKNKDEYSAWSKRLRGELLDRVFREWPDEIPAAEVREEKPDGRVILRTDAEVSVHAASIRRAGDGSPTVDGADKTPPQRLWLVVLNADEPEGKLPEWTKGVLPEGQSVTVLSPRGSGEFSAWTQKNPPNYVERAHALLGRTVDAGRVWDIQATARWLHEAEGNRLSVAVVGKGQAGVLGAYAALFETCIAEITLVDPPSTHRHGPHFLGVMKVLDIPEALGLLAPRRVTLIDAKDAAFNRTADDYEAAGYAGRIQRK